MLCAAEIHPSAAAELLLVVEAGNTTTSLLVFQGTQLLEARKVLSQILHTNEGCSAALDPLLSAYSALCHAALCSVVPELEQRVGEYLRAHLSGKVMKVSAALSLPFTLNYDSPDSFGADRIALCALCAQCYPDKAVIALDVGTAITVDVLAANQHYLGGMIMPGLDLMAKALHNHTARLPLVLLQQPATLLGCSTEDGIRNGILHGCASSLDGIIVKITRWLEEEHQEHDVQVMLTGGNAPLLARMLECSPVLDELAVAKGTRYLFVLNALLNV